MPESDLPVFGRTDWIVENVSKLPSLILHIREHAVPSMQAASGPRVSGSREQSVMPLNVVPLDDADGLWGRACTVAALHAHGSQSPEVLLVGETVERQWLNEAREMVGFASSEPGRIYSDVVEVARYLSRNAFSLAISVRLAAQVDDLIAVIKDLDGRYQGAPISRRASYRCPRCLRFAVAPSYSGSGEIKALTCGHCGAVRKFRGS